MASARIGVVAVTLFTGIYHEDRYDLKTKGNKEVVVAFKKLMLFQRITNFEVCVHSIERDHSIAVVFGHHGRR